MLFGIIDSDKALTEAFAERYDNDGMDTEVIEIFILMRPLFQNLFHIRNNDILKAVKDAKPVRIYIRRHIF